MYTNFIQPPNCIPFCIRQDFVAVTQQFVSVAEYFFDDTIKIIGLHQLLHLLENTNTLYSIAMLAHTLRTHSIADNAEQLYTT